MHPIQRELQSLQNSSTHLPAHNSCNSPAPSLEDQFAPTHVLPVPDTPEETQYDMQTYSHTGAHRGSVTDTHTLAICCVFIEMQENTWANLFTHPQGAHTHNPSDGLYNLTCTHLVMNKHKHATCACTPSCLHAQVPSPAPTLPCSHPPMCSHGGCGDRSSCEPCVPPAPLWPSQKGISSCKAAAGRFKRLPPQ